MIVALEGIPGGGKTSIIEHFAAKQDFVTIPEHIFSDQILGDYSKFAPRSEAMYKLHWETKFAMAELYCDRKILLDRYYITTLAYNYSAARVTGDHEIYDEMLAWFSSALEKGKLKPVDVCVYLDVEPVKANIRKNRTPIDTMLWSQYDYLVAAREFYREVLPTIATNYHDIVSINTEQTALKDAIKQIEEIF